MENKTYFNKYIHYSIYIFSAFLFSYFIDMSMPDDGLRHIAFSAHKDEMGSWGDIFPYSLFSSYDPWFLWHYLLEFILHFVPYSFVHVIVNFLSLFLLLIIIDILARREIKYDFASITYIIVFSIVYLSSYRYLMVRPDLLSGLFVMYALILKNKFFPMFILTLFYGPFYYLFFIYTGAIGLVTMVQKKWNAFFGVFLASVFVLLIHLVYDFEGYLETVKNILMDQKLRMGLEVGEGQAFFSFLGNINYFILLPVFFCIAFYLIYKNYEYFRKNSVVLFLLITSILWLNQVRYFVLLFPLITLFLVSIIINSNKKALFKRIRTYFVFSIKYMSYSKKAMIFYIIAIPYAIVAFSYSFCTKSLNEEIAEAQFFKDKIFINKTILLNNLNTDVYKALYHNPTIKFVPSCSVGWFDDKNKEMKDIYIRMQKKEGISELELKKLIEYVKADFYVHYLRNAKQVLDFDKLKEFGIVPEIIYHNRIIFKIKKEETK